VSSILEALRELEGERPPAVRREIPAAEKNPGVTRRAAGAVIPILGGIAVGILAFGLWAWAPGIVQPTHELATTSPAPAPVSDAPPAERPNWLDTAEAPRARVTPGATPGATPGVTPGATTAPAPTPPPRRTAAADATTAPAPPAAAPADTAAAPAPTGSGGQVAVEAISYAAAPGQRVATMRVHGKRVTLREREAVDGIEVQLIMPNGVYVQRGSEVYLLPLSR
jgi:hypothetical protein